MNSTGPKDAAAGPLDLLAAQLRDLGLTVTVPASHRASFPAPVVDAGTAEAVVMAGAVHYWQRGVGGDMSFIGPLGVPEKAAHAVHECLTDDPEQRHSHPFRFRTGTSLGRIREIAVVVGAPAVAVAGVAW